MDVRKCKVELFLVLPYKVKSVLKLKVMVETTIKTKGLWILLWVAYGNKSILYRKL